MQVFERLFAFQALILKNGHRTTILTADTATLDIIEDLHSEQSFVALE
jgi:hypothetical protein